MLITPFGCLEVRVDGRLVRYNAKEITTLRGLCADVLGRYQIDIAFVPDGKRHEISCTFHSKISYNRSPEPGENLECQGFYNSQGYKMSIGVKRKSGLLLGGDRISDRPDYDTGYLKNGMAYLVLERTKTENYTFGIAWIDRVDWESTSEADVSRDTETWFGADPTLTI